MRMRFIDWNQKQSYGVRTYIKQQIVDGVEQIHFINPKKGYVEGICFQNFPQLHIAQNQMQQCMFENCGEIFLTADCGHAWCHFKNIKALHCTGSYLTYCHFENIKCEGSAFVELSKCLLANSLFKNIKLMNEAWLVYGNGSSYYTRCELVDVTTERKDGELFAAIT